MTCGGLGTAEKARAGLREGKIRGYGVWNTAASVQHQSTHAGPLHCDMGGTRAEHGEAIDRYNFPFQPGEFGDDGLGKHQGLGGGAGQGCGIRPGRPGSLLGEGRVPVPGKFSPARPPRTDFVTLSGGGWFSRPTSQVRSTRLGAFREDVSHFLPGCGGRVGISSSRR